MRFIPQSSVLLASCLFFTLACSTVPDHAPKEYHMAHESIERAKDADADDTFPTTVDRAEKELDYAVELYKKHRDKEVPAPDRDALFQEGSREALKAKMLADEAYNMHSQVLAWDSKIETKAEGEKTAAELAALRDKVASLEASQQQTTALNANIKGPVAFFATNESSLSSEYSGNLESLASTLKSNPSMQVTLTGFADARGSNQANNRLAEERANSVASWLKSQGVSSEQILIDARGSSQATAQAGNAAGLQLDRRVDAFLMNRSGAEQMTTGR